MKNIIVAGLLFFTLTSACSGQKDKPSVSFHAGVSMVSLRGNDIIDEFHETAARVAARTELNIPLKKGFFISTGLGYEQKGSEIKKIPYYDNLGNQVGYENIKHKFSYLVLPVWFGKSFGQKLRFSIRSGLFGALMLQEKQVSKIQGGGKISLVNTGFYRKVDAGFLFGTGISLPLQNKKWRIGFDVTEESGFSDISTGPVINNGQIKTNSLNLAVGLYYQLK